MAAPGGINTSLSNQSSATTGDFGDSFFGNVNQSTGNSGGFDFVGKVVVPVSVSVVAGLIILHLSKRGRR